MARLQTTELGSVPGWSTPAGEDNSLLPTNDNTIDIGSPTNRVRKIYVAEEIVGAAGSAPGSPPVDAVEADPLVIDSAAANSDLTFTPVDPGDGITVELVYPGGAHDLTVEVNGLAITITLEHDGDSVVSTAADIVAAIEADAAASAIVTVEDEGDGSGLVDPTPGAVPMENGVDGTEGAPGQLRVHGSNVFVCVGTAGRSSQGKWKKVQLAAL